jgi:hypothetical protein
MQKKTKVVGKVVLALLVIGLGMLVRERIVATGAIGWVAAGWAMTALVLLRVALALRRGVRNWRRHAVGGVSLASIDAVSTATMPPWAQGWYAMEKQAYRYFWRALTGAAPRGAGPFTLAGGSQGGKRTACLVMMAALCGGAIGYFLSRHLAPGWPLAGAGAALLLALLYALVWIVGDRRSLREAGHAIDGAALVLDLGLRARASIALASLADCVAIGGDGGAGDGHAPVLRLTAGETANVALSVAAPFEAVVHGTARTLAAGRIVLYVDDPAAFIGAVKHAIAGRRQVA